MSKYGIKLKTQIPIHKLMNTCFLIKNQKIYNVINESIFNKWCWHNWVSTCKRMKINSLSPLPLWPQDLPRAAPWHSEPGLWAQPGRGSSCALRACLTGRPWITSATFLARKRQWSSSRHPLEEGWVAPGPRASARRNSDLPHPPQLSGCPAVVAIPCWALPNPIPALIQVHLPLFLPSPWGHKISPQLLPCVLGRGCEWNPARGSACVSIDCLKKGRHSVSEVPAQQGNLTWYQKIQYRAVEGKDGQTPRQELLQQSKKQHEITRSQRPYDRRTWTS